MLLKSIDIFGFKSFAEKAHIEFTDGISALLGPNGCGKSNIVDAIKWVLGEQAPRGLRAEKMEDVIFNGTDNRKALNVADVTLTMTNETGVLPLDVPEISIRRRLFRSGESEYYVNGAPVKLKELRELFYDTGIGKSAYSIMEQGKIDQVLSNKPEERRNIFEEAATITKFKIRGKEAERKLERTEENMRQVESILGEVKRSYESLKRQSDKTLSYREIRDKSFSVEIDLQLLKLRDFLEDKRKKEAQLKEKTTARDETKKKIDGINDSLEQNLDIVNSMEESLIANQKRLYQVEVERSSKDGQIRMLNERRSEIADKVRSDVARKAATEEKIRTLSQTMTETEASVAELAERLGEVEKNITEFEHSIGVAGGKIRGNDATILDRTNAITRSEQNQDELQRRIQELTDDIVTQLDAKLAESGYSSRERSTIEAAVQNELSSLAIHLSGKHAILRDAIELSSGGKPPKPQTLEAVERAFLDAESAVGRLDELFVRYRGVTPAFLDDFLAPEGIITRKRELDAEIESERAAVRAAKDEIVKLTEENRQLNGKIDEYRKTLEGLRVEGARMTAQAAALRNAILAYKRDIAELNVTLESVSREIEQSEQRTSETTEKIKTLEAEKLEMGRLEKKLQTELGALEKTISTKNKDLVDKERTLKTSMEELARTQSQVEKLQMDAAELTAEIRNIYANFRDRHSRDLSEYESRAFEITDDAKVLRDSLSSLRDQEKALGPVNLMAPEEFLEVKERFDFLTTQIDDLHKAREDLIRVTSEIKKESEEMFVETYEKIKRNFHTLFRRLFGGGRAEIRLTDPDNVLESGIDILAQPPGKKLENIALLSGGERSLTAVGLLFATYMVKPSPFCLLDEIDAALDESNVGRFIGMLNEFSENSQFIIITHNKKTVAGAKTLLGITMEESGVSKVVSIRLDSREPVNV